MKGAIVMALNNFTGHDNDADKNNNNGTPTPPFSIGGNVIGGTATPFAQDDDDDMIESILINYNEKFKLTSLCMFRDEILRIIEAVLIGKTKPNCIVVGPAGTGKTKIIEYLAHKIANKDPYLPDALLNKIFTNCRYQT